MPSAVEAWSLNHWTTREVPAQTTFCLSIQPAMDTWIVSPLGYNGIMLLWTWVYKYLFGTLLSILLDIYPDVGLLDHMVVLFLIFWGPSILFSTAVVPSYNPTNNAIQCIFFCSVENIPTHRFRPKRVKSSHGNWNDLDRPGLGDKDCIK